MSESNQSAYRNVFKATTLFGGVQAYNILISLVRAKFVAIFLGPAGMGILNLLQMPLGLIQQLTGLGISYSAIRDISQASASGDEEKIGRTLSVFRKWVWWTGLAGVAVTMALSPLLSRWTFGNGDYTYSFLLLSSTLLFTALSSGYGAALQGLRKLRYLARASVIGATVGLLVSIPLYYYFRIKGIVPTIIIASITTLILNWFYSRKITIKKITVTWKEVWYEGNSMAKLGLLITISGLILTFVSYLINIYISRTGGIDQVGLYQAGFSITDKYVGMIFAAMATDYYPRLAGIVDDRKKMIETVNQQAEISLLILGPVLLMLLTTLPLVIRILYTPQFLKIMEFVPWIILGMPVKAASWSMGFIILAQGKSRMYFFSELFASALLLIFCILGYRFLGMQGLGLAFLFMYLLYFIYLLAVCTSRFSFSFLRTFYGLLAVTMILCGISVFLFYYISFPTVYYFGSIISILSLTYSIYKIHEKVNLKNIILNLFKK